MSGVWLLLLVGSFSGVRSQSGCSACDSVEQVVERIIGQNSPSEEAAKRYLADLNRKMDLITNENMVARWEYETNINKETQAMQIAVESENAKFQKMKWVETKKYPWQTYSDPNIKRQLYMFSILGPEALPDEKYAEYKKVIGDMTSIYNDARVCHYKNRTRCDMALEPDISKIMAKSRDPEELKYYWIEWHEASGTALKHLYPRYVELSNEAAVLNGFTDAAAYWLWMYEDENFAEIISELWKQLKPLYLQIHAFIRRKLREKYGENIVPREKPIPSHLLGNIWGQQWHSIPDLTFPFNMNKSIDVTPQMVKQGYTPKKIFEVAEDFYTSINLSPMPETFWRLSLLEKPKDGRKVDCQANAWDFFDGKDYRIKQCTKITHEHLRIAHREMGLLEYYLQYKDQPYIFKRGANPGFQEAIGDTIVLSMQTLKHLQRLGLVDNSIVLDIETELNDLLGVALRKIIMLPYAYIMDLWRWDVFKGKITKDQYNCAWWKLRADFQGLEPPIDRSEASFDPGTKYHIAAGKEYLRYFVSFIVQFQFHQALCEKTGQYDPKNPDSKPLHRCDIYKSTEAGDLLKKMLQLGASVPWPEAMKVMTGQDKMDVSALRQYFRPLEKYLEEENKRTGEYIGWTTSERKCMKSN